MAKQINNEVIKLLGDYNRSIAPRQLILVEEANANPALNAKCMANWNLITSWIIARWGSEETPATLSRIQQAVSALHKGGAGLYWMDGKTPGMVRETEQPEAKHQNTQADLIQRQTEDRQKKIDATTLANAQSRCSNYDCQPHSVKFDRRKKLLSEFERLKNTPGISAEAVAKGVDIAIAAMEKTAAVGPRIRGI